MEYYVLIFITIEPFDFMTLRLLTYLDVTFFSIGIYK